ncbi:hypothetical protein [Agrococcus sp. HG114]|uniref:hypothetical protein n=1 Tax=Agrococcus sp. HG114 TaxID=2969757 RepID=UPI00215A5AEA|nr:hypothetical protein [Agrococcus sp. HG114]MCR8671161.1 hypothetical protein [Agrococcus sp. HG114]
MTLTPLTSALLGAAEHAESSADAGFGPYIAAGITAAVFIFSAIVLRSFRDVAHRSERHDVHGNA